MKIQNEMSTRISVETVSAIGSLSAFRNAIKATSNSWRAQETAMKNSGDYAGAVRERISGLTKVMDLQRAKIRELRQEQDGLDTSNKKQANQFLKLEKQISQANKQLASYDGQAIRAKSAAAYQVSGLADLQHAYRSARSSSNAYVERLNAEGRSASATVEKYRGLGRSLTNLQSQYRKQEFLLKQVENQSGRDSDAYRKQKEQLDKTATSIAKTKTEMSGMKSEVASLQPTGISRIDNAVVKVRDHTSELKTRAVSAFDSMKQHAMAIGVAVATTTVALNSAAQKAGAIQKVYVENQNLMTTAGEKSAAAQKEVNQMYSRGQKLSVQYGVSQKEIADGYQTLIKRGYDGKQALGAMNSILQASKASGDSFDDTMKVTTSTLEAFGMKAETTSGIMRNTAKVSDILSKAADVTSTSFKDIGEAMTYAGPSAKATGVSLKETSAILGVLSNNSLEATQAGTGLQRIITRLAAPTASAKAALKQYNMSIDDFHTKSGKLKPISGIFKEINKNVPDSKRLEFFNQVFGQTAQGAASILSRTASLSKDNSKSLDHVENQLKTAYSEDYVGKLARKNMRAAKNSQDRFKYASQAIQIEIGRKMLPAISKASVAMADAFGRKDTQQGLNVIAKGIGAVANAAVGMLTFLGKHTTIVKIFGATMLAAFASAKLLSAIGRLRSIEIPRMISGFQAMTKALKLVTLGWNPLVIGIELVIGALFLLYKHSAKFRKFVNGLVTVTAKGMKSLGKWFSKTFSNITKTILKHNERQSKLQKQQERQTQQHYRQNRKEIINFWKSAGRAWSQGTRNLARFNQKAFNDGRRTWNNLSRNVQHTSSSMWQRASRDARNGWNYVVRWGGNSSKTVARSWDWMNRQTTRVAQRMFKNHRRTFQSGYKVIEDRTRLWKDLMTGHWGRLSTDTQRTVSDMNKFHQRLFRDMYNRLNNMTDGRLGDMVKSWQDKMGSIGDTVANARQTIHNHFVDLVRGIIKPFNDMLEDLHKGINWVLDKVGASKIGGDWSVPMPSYAAGTPGAHPGGFAKVNDGQTAHYREMYKLPNGEIGMFPAVRNMILPLPKGAQILDGERSYALMRMMGRIPHYANGTLDAVGNFFSNLSDDVENFMDNVEKFVAHPVEFMESVFKRFVKVSTPIQFATDLVQHVPVYIAQHMVEWVKKQLEVLSNPGGSGVERWRPYIVRAAKMEGIDLTSTMMRKMLTQINTESHGNPSAIGGTDGLNDGHATGLLQFKPGTFRHWIWHGHGNIMNGFDQILAAFNALQHGGEGGWGNFGIPGRGWANGGLVRNHQWIEIAEQNKPEYVIPTDINKRSRAYQLLGEVVARFQADDPQRRGNLEFSGNRDTDVLNSKFDQLLKKFDMLLEISSGQLQATKDQGVLDPQRLYKRMAKDQAMRQFG